jgi:DNA repair exonuclease SbcCD ATPase subunit
VRGGHRPRRVRVHGGDGARGCAGDLAHLTRYVSALPINLDKEIDRLYGLPLDKFTGARDTRVKELRNGGEREAADHLKKARKPTAAAWAANQLARTERMNVRALLTAGDQLRDGQAELIRGGNADDLRRAQESERRALTALMDAGKQLVDGDATLRKLESTLRAAVVDLDARELLERGRLTKELTPSGFGFAGMPAPSKRRRVSPAKAKERDEAAERHKRELAEARAALQEAQKRARTAEREAEKTRKELEKAQEQVQALERSKR